MQPAEPDWKNLYRDLVRFAQKKLGDKSMAQDIVQDALIKAYTRKDQLKDREKFSTWVYQITRNTIVDHVRKKQRTIPPVDADWRNDPQDLNDCAAYCLMVLLRTLPEKYRIALELTEAGELSQHDLAKKLKLSHAGARSRVQRGRKMLKEKMDQLFVIRTDCYGNVIFCEDRNPYCCKS
jgi:RNA polymerase sigma-70 factor, ECF subfamily